MNVVIRDCRASDVPASLAIYNELIATTSVAWTERPMTSRARRLWMAAQAERGFPVLVAEADAEVIGVASYGDFRDTTHWEGYRVTVEHSIHVRGDRWGLGVGRLLMDGLVARARASGIHVMVGAVDAANVDSIRFHERMGFAEVARMPEVGIKRGRRLDLVFMQRILD